MANKYFDQIDWTSNLKVASGTITATASDTKTNEKVSSDIYLPDTVEVNPQAKYLLKLEVPIMDTAGNAVFNIYNRDAIDGTNVRTVLRDTTSVAYVTSTSSYGDKLVEGLFIGSESAIRLGVTYSVDTSVEVSAAYSIYRV
jgi:hypothetical protein